jgi:hypothetical protein
MVNEILELQYSSLIHSRGHRASLVELINQKEVVGDLFNQLRLALQRRTKARPAQVSFVLLYAPYIIYNVIACPAFALLPLFCNFA